MIFYNLTNYHLTFLTMILSMALSFGGHSATGIGPKLDQWMKEKGGVRGDDQLTLIIKLTDRFDQKVILESGYPSVMRWKRDQLQEASSRFAEQVASWKQQQRPTIREQFWINNSLLIEMKA